jgi:cyclase
VRIIPRLDIKGPNLVKGIQLEGLRVLGKPEYYARTYYEQGADELLFMDVVASLYGRNNLLDIIARTARQSWIPLTVGGGLRTLEDIRDALRAGADKVAINTAAISDPLLVQRAARLFGSSTIVVSIEAIRQPNGDWHAYTCNGRNETGIEAVSWAAKAEELGAGEILITSVDREGTGKGCDLELTRRVAETVTIPVIAGGGVGGVQHVREVLTSGGADAVAIASMLHYAALPEAANRADFAQEGNLEFLQQPRLGRRLDPTSLLTLKRALLAEGWLCRPVS